MKEAFLFDKKEMYAQTHTNKGIPVEWVKLTQSSQYRKQRYDNLHVTVGMTFTTGLGLPIMQAYTLSTDFEVHSFKERNKLTGKGQAIHWFGDDYTFDGLLWHRLHVTTMELYKFDCVFAPDYSIYVDMPYSYNLGNLYKSRCVGSYWQMCGYNVIPTISWGDADSMRYCFDGLPSDSVLAVCGTGHEWCCAARRLWEYGMRELEARLCPRKVYVYGKPAVVPGFTTPLIFIEDYVTKKYRKSK